MARSINNFRSSYLRHVINGFYGNIGCMNHARRKFAAIVKVTKKTGTAHYAVAVIAKLYRI